MTERSAVPAIQHPAGLLYGPGHVVVYANAPFRELFGSELTGLPAAEILLDLPRSALELLDLVYRDGRPLARWITMHGTEWRLTVAPRGDIGTGQVYGVAVNLVPREHGRPMG
jgi:PAS domain-containing protein